MIIYWNDEYLFDNPPGNFLKEDCLNSIRECPVCGCQLKIDKENYLKISYPKLYHYLCPECGYEDESEDYLPDYYIKIRR